MRKDKDFEEMLEALAEELNIPKWGKFVADKLGEKTLYNELSGDKYDDDVLLMSFADQLACDSIRKVYCKDLRHGLEAFLTKIALDFKDQYDITISIREREEVK